MRHFALLLVALSLAGCDRPIVDPLPVDIETVGVDLSVVRTEATLPLALRVGALDRVTNIEISGNRLTFDDLASVFRDTLTLAEGLNVLPVRAFDGLNEVRADTLYAVYLPIARGQFVPGLPPRIYAAASALPDGRAVVTGGVAGDPPALATMDVLTPDGLSVSIQSFPLQTGRVGHTSVQLPDERLLLLGGAVAARPSGGSDFVTSAELIDPADMSSRSIPIEGTPLRRTGLSARVLQREGRTIIYAFGGLAPVQVGAAPSGSVSVLEWIDGPEPVLRSLSPVGGAGSFTATEDHVQLDVPVRNGNVATAVVVGEFAAFAFEWRVPGGFYPFDLVARNIDLPDAAKRLAAASVALDRGVGLLLGGRTRRGETLDRVDVYADGARRVFKLPDGLGLQAARYGHVATKLGDGRIVVIGGVSSSGAPLSGIELYRL